MLCVTCVAIAVVVMIQAAPYRMARLTSFTDPFADAFDNGYQLVHSLIAIGRGEFGGVGIGGSIQKLYYLPHAIGIVLVIGLFVLLLRRIFVIARQADDAGMIFGGRLAQGIGLLLIIQAMINIGVNLGVLPTKGLNLPFISFGGSSMLVCCIAIGMVFAVDKQSKVRQVAPVKQGSTKLGMYKDSDTDKESLIKRMFKGLFSGGDA